MTYQFGEFTLDVSRGSLFKGRAEVKLRPKVFEALKYLVENPGRLIAKEELIGAVWPDAAVTDDSVVQCTVELRRALDDRGQLLLKTVPRRGYVFAARVIQEAQTATESCRLPTFGDAGDNVDLPAPRASLIGREREIAQAAAMLRRPDIRLLSLTGAGGAGKTRMAIAVAASIAHEFPAGVRFVALAPIAHASLVTTALAEAFDVHQVAKRSIAQLIGDRLKGSEPFLLVLDNFEHVLSAAKTVAEILAACPSLKILVTTRACLRIYGEQEFPVAPLEQNFAIELFVQRAKAVLPTFALTPQNEPAIQSICSRLDGLPLAIELAAARTRVLSPSAILDRLQSRLQFLTGGALDMPERQQTLRKTIDWSYDLLDGPEQKLFRRLAVFPGGCTIEAAEAVCNARRDLGIDPFDGLSSLVDKNLAQRDHRNEPDPRFRMLETIREYARQLLAESGEEFDTRRAHAAYCLVLAEEGNPELTASQRAGWLARCDSEIDNFRAALDWLFETENLDWGVRLCMALFRFWDMREHLIEGRARLETILRLAGEGYPKERARVSQFLGALATAQGDFEAARRFLEQSLSLYEQLDDRWGVAIALNALAVSARDRGDYASALKNFESSLAQWRTLGDRVSAARCLHNLANAAKICGDYAKAEAALREAAGIFQLAGDRSGAAWSINQQGDIARERGDLVSARASYERGLASFREAGDLWGEARSLTDLGQIYCEEGEHAAARESYREALEIFAGLGHRRGIARALEGTASLAMAQGQAARALRLAAAATQLRETLAAPLPVAEQTKLNRKLLPAWDCLAELDARSAWSEGAAMTVEDAVRYSMEQPSTVT